VSGCVQEKGPGRKVRLNQHHQGMLSKIWSSRAACWREHARPVPGSAFGYLQAEKMMWLLNSSEMLLLSLGGMWPSPSPPGRERGGKKKKAFSSWSQAEAAGWSNKAFLGILSLLL